MGKGFGGKIQKIKNKIFFGEMLKAFTAKGFKDMWANACQWRVWKEYTTVPPKEGLNYSFAHSMHKLHY